jgi:hypothetical protein
MECTLRPEMDDNQTVFDRCVTKDGFNVKAYLSDWHRQARNGRVMCIVLALKLAVNQGLFWFGEIKTVES